MLRRLSTWLMIMLLAGSLVFPATAQQEPEPPEPAEQAGEEESEPAAEPPAAPAPVAPGRRPARPAAAARGDLVSLNFNRADLVEVVHILAQHLNLTYTIDPEVKGSVTIYSAEPLKKEDLLPIFHQVLRINSAVAVKTGNLYRITPIKEGKALARPSGPSREDSFALQVVPVRFFSVTEMKRLLTPFITPGGEIIEYPRGNFLIVVDLPSNIQRLAEIRDLIDVQVFAGTRMEIYQPRVASAEELAGEMTKIMQSYASSVPQAEGFAAQFLPLPRINQLLVISHSEAAWTYAKRWLERIDVVAEGPGRRIFIYPVENGKATELAEVLSQALGQPFQGRKESPMTLQDLHRSTAGGFGQPGNRSMSSSGFGGASQGNPQSSLPGAFATIPTPGQARPPAATPAPAPAATPRPSGEPSPGGKPEEQMRIVPDPATNSLVIYGTAQEFQNIKNILKELDIIPRQVLMDVMVAEVTLADDLSFGIEYEIFRRAGVSIFGRSFSSQGAVRSGILPAAPETGLAQFGSGISGVAGRSNAVRAFINALAVDSKVKVLSSPSVLATDNRPARIQVGSEVPILTSQSSGITTDAIVINNVQYRNTGVILTIIPQVNSQGLVNLQVKQEVSDIGAQSFGETRSPSFTTRDAETTAVVQDGETLVIGGIISERKSRDRTGIPFLMDIPVLGRFFGTTTDAVDRTELIILVTPQVIRSREDSRIVTEEFKNRLTTLKNELERQKKEEKKAAPPPEEKPAAPKPSSYAPAPQLESAPARRETSGGKLKSITVPAGVFPSQISEETPRQTLRPKPLGRVPAPARETAAAIVPEKVEAPDARKAAGTPPPAPREVPASRAEGLSKAAEPPARPAGRWVVQVASYADKKDAESLAKSLAAKGYDAYVIAAEVKEKTWHRVRVGRPASLSEARELQKKLAAAEKLEETYIAAR